MNDRDRLVELIIKSDILCHTCGENSYSYCAEALADCFLANGVIVPPCKVGDTVYVINDCEVEETAVFSMKIESEDEHWVVFVKAKVADYGIKIANEYGSMFKTFVFGKTVFLTHKEAEQTLKEKK